VNAGDAFFFQPGEAHQLTNVGDEDFVYYVIAIIREVEVPEIPVFIPTAANGR